MVPDDFSAENQQALVDGVTGGISDGFGENGLAAAGHDAYLDLDLDVDPNVETSSGPTVPPTIAVLAFAGTAEALAERIDASKADGTFSAAMQSTLETMQPLALAISSGDVAKVKLLIDAGADPAGAPGDSPLKTTAQVGTHALSDETSADIARLLIDTGAPKSNVAEAIKFAESRGKRKLSEFLRSL